MGDSDTVSVDVSFGFRLLPYKQESTKMEASYHLEGVIGVILWPTVFTTLRPQTTSPNEIPMPPKAKIQMGGFSAENFPVR